MSPDPEGVRATMAQLSQRCELRNLRRTCVSPAIFPPSACRDLPTSCTSAQHAGSQHNPLAWQFRDPRPSNGRHLRTELDLNAPTGTLAHCRYSGLPAALGSTLVAGWVWSFPGDRMARPRPGSRLRCSAPWPRRVGLQFHGDVHLRHRDQLVALSSRSAARPRRCGRSRGFR